MGYRRRILTPPKRVDTKYLEGIYDTFGQLIEQGKFKEAEEYVKETYLSSNDSNTLRTLMVLIKGLKNREGFSKIYEDINQILETQTNRVIK